MKKYIILTVLFIMPICAYLFFATGVNQFAQLPTLTVGVNELPEGKTWSGNPIVLKDKITVIGFPGFDMFRDRGNAFNLDQKIYKRYRDFNDFQVVFVAPIGSEEEVKRVRAELEPISDLEKWDYLFLEPEEITAFYDSFKIHGKLDKNLGTPDVFILDKERNLRGRKGKNHKGEEEYREGYNTISAADLHNEMMDDMKVILAEYRLALKKYNKIVSDTEIK
ncbi:hypothetical protein [Flavobacterium sp. JP2137]|uniref:hypothetical protein n=1 Tax=Flavobacterium sp. JP2137 TaxID=3414510 RepID=UPI003D301713